MSKQDAIMDVRDVFEEQTAALINLNNTNQAILQFLSQHQKPKDPE